MKSYEEMTQSVLTRAKAQRKTQKRRRATAWTSVAIAGCLCMALLAVVNSGQSAPQNPAQQLETTPKARIMLLTDAEDFQSKELVRDVMEPYRFLIRVTDATGMDADARKAAMDAEKEYSQQMWTPSGANRSFTCYGGEKAIISLMSAGRLMVIVDDYDMIKDYKVTTTDNGYISDYAHVDQDVPGVAQGIGFGWTLSNAAIEQLEADPATQLSGLSDTITVSLEFLDGTTQTIVADVIIQDDGQVFIVHRGSTVTV